MVIKGVTKKHLDKIKDRNEDDYNALIIAAHIYTENEKQNEPSNLIQKSMLSVITTLLDKYEVQYVNDLC